MHDRGTISRSFIVHYPALRFKFHLIIESSVKYKSEGCNIYRHLDSSSIFTAVLVKIFAYKYHELHVVFIKWKLYIWMF